MSLPICVTCGVQYAAPRDDCPVCEDPRQYVPVSGQAWTTLEELRSAHTNAIIREGELIGIGTRPKFAIGQRALLVPAGSSNVLWDCVTLLDEMTAGEIESRGGLRAIAISHPHYYSTMVEWAHRFSCEVWLHEDDREWVMREDPSLRFWSGETATLGDGLTLIRCGGHFAGGTVLHRERDLLTVTSSRSSRTTTGSRSCTAFPTTSRCRRRRSGRSKPRSSRSSSSASTGPGGGPSSRRDGKGIVRRSAQRYVDALNGKLP